MMDSVQQTLGRKRGEWSMPEEALPPSQVDWLSKWSRGCCGLLACATLASIGFGCQHLNAVDSALLTVSPADTDLDRVAISVANHCGVTMARYHCSFDGHPFQFRAWWEVSVTGQQPTKVGIVWVKRDKDVMPKLQDYEGFIYVWTDSLKEHLPPGSVETVIPLVASHSIVYQAGERTALRLTVECDGVTRTRTVEIPGIVVPTPTSSGGHLAIREGQVLCLQSCSLLPSRDEGAIHSGEPKRDEASEKIALSLKVMVEPPGAGWPPPYSVSER